MFRVSCTVLRLAGLTYVQQRPGHTPVCVHVCVCVCSMLPCFALHAPCYVLASCVCAGIDGWGTLSTGLQALGFKDNYIMSHKQRPGHTPVCVRVCVCVCVCVCVRMCVRVQHAYLLYTLKEF